MATSLESLNRAYEDTISAHGPDFFRRLRDYHRLLTEDRAIRQAVADRRATMEEAERAFATANDHYVQMLIACRDRFVELVPGENDSDLPRPELLPEWGNYLGRRNEWTWTLANFDAIVAGDGHVERRGLDASTSRMLGEILQAKLFALLDDPADISGGRSELRDLQKEVQAIVNEQAAARRQLDELAESSGYLSLVRLEIVASYLGPREDPPPSADPGSDEQRQYLERLFGEVSGSFHHLRTAVEPEEARGSLDAAAKEAVSKHEATTRTDLENVQRVLKAKLEASKSWTHWSEYSRSDKIAVIAVGVALLSIVVAILIAILAGA